MMATLHSHTQNLGNGDRHDNELGSCIQRVLGIFDVHDGPAADHDLAIVLQVMEQALGSLLYVAKILVVLDFIINYLLAEVRNKIQAPGSGESELHDVETTVDCSLHGLGGRILGGRAKNSTCTILRMGG